MTSNDCHDASKTQYEFIRFHFNEIFHLNRHFPDGFQPTARVGLFRNSLPVPPVGKNFFHPLLVIVWYTAFSMPLLTLNAHFIPDGKMMITAMVASLA
jgi:hypothetical protein